MNDFEGLLAFDFSFKPQGNRLQWPVPNPPPPLEDHQRVLAPSLIPSKITILSSSSAPPPPVYDKPVYDDDIFDGIPRLKSSTANAKYEEIFTSVAASSPPKWSGSGIGSGSGSDAFDNLLVGFGNVDCSYNLSPEELCTKISLCI